MQSTETAVSSVQFVRIRSSSRHRFINLKRQIGFLCGNDQMSLSAMSRVTGGAKFKRRKNQRIDYKSLN